MQWQPATPKVVLRRVAILLLLVGWVSAGVIYLTVEDEPENPWVEEIQNSKKYRHEIEVYGGKLNIIGNDLSRWWDRLWHGKALALTIAALTAFTSLMLIVAASHLQLPPADSAKK